MTNNDAPTKYPAPLCAVTLATRLAALVNATGHRLDDENADRQLLLENLLADLGELAALVGVEVNW
jgi:hypothetical protein